MDIASGALLSTQVAGIILVMIACGIALFGLVTVAFNIVICTRWSRNSTTPQWQHPRAAYLQTFTVTALLAVAGMLFWRSPNLITGSEEWALLKAGEVWSAVVMPFSPLPWGVLGLVIGVVSLRLAWRASRTNRRSTTTLAAGVPPQLTGAVSV